MRGNRHSIRLAGYDYTRPGAYFVTLCVQNRECLFGEITDGEMRLNEYGNVVRDEWLRTAEMRSEITLDAFVIMPNHFHAILVIGSSVGATRGSPLQQWSPLQSEIKPGAPNGSLGAIIALFKSASGKRINEFRGTPGMRIWQRNYHDHIVRHDDALNRIRRYIEMNPLKWKCDQEKNIGRNRE